MTDTIEPLNLPEYEPLAREKLSEGAYGFIAGGAGDEVTLNANREAFQRISLRPRVLVDVSEIDSTTTVLGQTVDFPVLLAPVAMQRLAHPDGELAAARAAASAGTIFVLSTMSSYSLEEIAEATDGPKWFQLYCVRDREATERLVKRADAAGYTALCVTVDVPWLGRRETDLRTRFQFPPDMPPKNLVGELDLSRVTAAGRSPAVASAAAGLQDPSLTWSDIDRIRALTSIPLVLKGILTAEDARLAVEHGAQAIIVSNHGGRQLDGAIPAIDALPEVLEAVAGRAEVLVDGGVRRGTDVLKAMALGAKAALIGRPYIWGLAVDGEAGASRVLSLLREELALAMALAGRTAVPAIDRSLIA